MMLRGITSSRFYEVCAALFRRHECFLHVRCDRAHYSTMIYYTLYNLLQCKHVVCSSSRKSKGEMIIYIKFFSALDFSTKPHENENLLYTFRF